MLTAIYMVFGKHNNMDKKIYLEKLPYYEHLTDEQKETVLANWTRRTFKKGQLIHNSIDDCLGQIYLISGSLRAFVVSEDGREITLFRMAENDTCVLSASCAISQITFDTGIICESDSEVLILNSAVFSKLTEENIYVKCYMYELLSNRFSTVMFTMQEIIFKGFDRRLAGFLISEYERTGLVEIRMTHEQIAKYTNSAREVVARMLKSFSNDGLVEVKRGVIKLKDIEALDEIK